MSHASGPIRGAALDLLTSSFSEDPRILNAIFEAWDRYGPDSAFHDFPLISHLPIPADRVPECLERAAAMSAGRALADRVCRCAGKLIEALSISPVSFFAPHLDAIEALKKSSKIFFRVSIDSMRERATALQRATDSLDRDFEDGHPIDIVIALESLYRRGEAGERITQGLRELTDETSRSPLAIAVLELASRHPLVGFEEELFPLVDLADASLADPATIALVRCRNARVQTLIAERFPTLSRSGQLRCVEIVQRARLPKGAELLRFLLPHGQEFHIQDAMRVAEILVFDFTWLEEWLEALLLIEDSALRRVLWAIPLAEPLAVQMVPDEWPRVRQLIRSRVGTSYFA